MTIHLRILAIFFLLLARNESNEEKIEDIRIVYLPERSTVMVPVTCSTLEEVFDLRKEKVIVNARTIRSISDEIEKLTPQDTLHSMDVRMKLMIKYQGRVDTLCMGAFFGVMLNGELMEDNRQLLDIVKRKIYK